MSPVGRSIKKEKAACERATGQREEGVKKSRKVRGRLSAGPGPTPKQLGAPSALGTWREPFSAAAQGHQDLSGCLDFQLQPHHLSVHTTV